VKKTLLFLLLIIAVKSYSQHTVSCNDLKNGIYYYYTKNSPSHYILYRTENFQKEVDLTTGDTSLWKIAWQSDCKYSLQFVSSSLKRDPEFVKLLKNHKLVYTVTAVTDDYYAFRGYVDKESNPPIIADTIWLREKANISNSVLFKQLANDNETRRLKDTSRYAILYLYRPGKITNSLANYFVYFDEEIMCIAQNNSGYVFKVFKEGKFEVKSRLFKDESSVKLDIRFGNKYYVKSMIHWGISTRLYNFKLEMATVALQEGQTEFENIKNR